MDAKFCSLQIDTKQREIANRGTPMFPCGAYTVAVGDSITECVPWHWHEEIEVIATVDGAMLLEVPDQRIVVHAGEAVFINSSVLHSAVSADNSVCKINSFVFDPQLIFGSLESAIEQKYVRPLMNCPSLPVIHFADNLEWHQDAAGCIRDAFAHYQGESFGHEMLIRDYLSRLWFLIVSNQKSEIEQHQNSKNTETLRVKEMLGYIHDHYAEEISLKDISDSAAVSERECLRCFNKVLGTTPMKYLLRYRVSTAAGLLTNSNLNITEICKLSGFESPSYFSLRFKALTDMTPSEYRQQGKGAV